MKKRYDGHRLNRNTPPPRTKIKFTLSITLSLTPSLTVTYTNIGRGAERLGADERGCRILRQLSSERDLA